MVKISSKIQKYTDPWEHYVIDDFLSYDRFEEIKNLLTVEEEYLELFGFYTRSNHYFRFEKKDVIPEINEVFNYLFPDRDKNLKKVNHWTIHPANFDYNLHIDNKSRLYTAVLYLKPENNIGTFVAKNRSEFVDNHQSPSLDSEYTKEIKFKPNRLFVHKSDPYTWHAYASSTQRCTYNTFLIDPAFVEEGRPEKDKKFHIDINN